MRGGRLAWLVAGLLSASVFVPCPADAAPLVRDGNAFSVDLSEADVCYVTPLPMRTEADCHGLDLGNVPIPRWSKESPTIAYGLLRVPGSTRSTRLMGSVSVQRWVARGRSRAKVDGAAAREIVDEFVRNYESILRPGEHPVNVVSRVTASGGVRGSFGIEGSARGHEDELEEQAEVLFVLAAQGTYVLTWVGPKANAPALERFAEAAASSVKTSENGVVGANPAPLAHRLLARAILIVMVLVAVGFAIWLSRQRSAS